MRLLMETGTAMSTENQPKESLGWSELQGLKEKALEVLEDALVTGTPRDKLSAAMMVKGMDDSNIKVEEFKDKTARLDAGMPTDITDTLTLGEAAKALTAQLEQIIQPRKIVEHETDDDNLRID